MTDKNQPLLRVSNLKTHFENRDGVVRAVDGVSFDVMPGETLAVVGESGCGKSVTSLSILRLIPTPPARIMPGSRIEFKGRNLLELTDAQMRQIRGNEISMIFQEPMTSLNPVLTIGRQISEALVLHKGMTKQQATERAVEMLRRVNIPEPERRITQYPHELSGGMRQRVMIAMAFSCDPALLIADEPTTALDVTVQRQVLQLLRHRARQRGAAILFITHDMAVVSQFCDRVYVMYAGTVVEQGPTGRVLNAPRHPYTRGLLDGLPERAEPGADLAAIPGRVPDMRRPPQGCVFFDRCAFADEACRRPPELRSVADGVPERRVACWHPLAPGPAAGDMR